MGCRVISPRFYRGILLYIYIYHLVDSFSGLGRSGNDIVCIQIERCCNRQNGILQECGWEWEGWKPHADDSFAPRSACPKATAIHDIAPKLELTMRTPAASLSQPASAWREAPTALQHVTAGLGFTVRCRQHTASNKQRYKVLTLVYINTLMKSVRRSANSETQ